ncbi:PA0061/PA0062 family lipoprotein [Pseudomonas sp. KNUC1026]|uniref:PA0061/PA0062 family lipoprotein n=1 Tax=Pseudomonas sp. KNUC1026 TaxID=2893890 RepID=UPI001F2B1537|nr:hypothetical protein [Pseudomonas sp. KNUC1026]UFH49409.1 hypothetical protein LN139_21605 [Pseudomonas sp. KNUC1026]
MREKLLLCGLLALPGCSLIGLPSPDPHQAWVDLQVPQNNSLHAQEVDAKQWEDKRYFEVQPGSHELTVRYQFAVAPTNIGPDANPLWRDCQLNVKFAHFNAGERYRLQAGTVGFTPWAKLYDERNKLVSKGQPAGCQRA